MLATVEITPWHWGGFIVFILLALAWDLGFCHRGAKVVSVKSALCWTAFWIALALLFAAALIPMRGKAESLQFFTGYLVELTLSMDNMFVIALVFTYFRVPAQYQYRVLFWGVLGALIMRGLMIGLGAALIARFEWLLYAFGAFLILTGFKMLLSRDNGIDPDKSFIVRAARRVLPMATEYDGQKFVTVLNGRRVLTPLFLVLLAVEASDLVFATDSIPAVFGVTRKPFIVFTSNVFAILGLRSMYFLLAGALTLFRYFKTGISVVLIFIGAKMVMDPHDHPPAWYQFDIPDGIALAVVVCIIGLSIAASLVSARKQSAKPS